MALDNPSVTLLAFMNKYYGMGQPIWQNTYFVVFPKFFEAAKQMGETHRQKIAHSFLDKNDEKAIDGWAKPHTPRHIGAQGTTDNRYLSQTGRDSASKVALFSLQCMLYRKAKRIHRHGVPI